MQQPADHRRANTTPSKPAVGVLRIIATSSLGGVAGGIFGAIAAQLLGLSRFLAGSASALAMALLVALILMREAKRTANKSVKLASGTK